MRTVDALQNIGLNEKEAKIYMALLKLGRSSAYAIAERAEVKKPTTYVVLDELVEKGFVQKVPRAKKQLYEPKPPEEIFAEAEERFRLSKSVLPELTAMRERPAQHFRTLYYDGERGIRQMTEMMNRRMKGEEIIGFYAKVVSESERLEPFFHELNERRKGFAIRMRGMTPDDPSLQWYRERIGHFGFAMKFLDTRDYASDVHLEIADTFIQFVSHRYLQGVHIENPDVAEQMRQIFEMLWTCRQEEVQEGDTVLPAGR